MCNIKFTQFFTGKQGDMPQVAVRFNDPLVNISWRVRSRYTGWMCSEHGEDNCEHSDIIEEMLPNNLVKYFSFLEDRFDLGKVSFQQKTVTVSE